MNHFVIMETKVKLECCFARHVGSCSVQNCVSHSMCGCSISLEYTYTLISGPCGLDQGILPVWSVPFTVSLPIEVLLISQGQLKHYFPL